MERVRYLWSTDYYGYFIYESLTNLLNDNPQIVQGDIVYYGEVVFTSPVLSKIRNKQEHKITQQNILFSNRKEKNEFPHFHMNTGTYDIEPKS